MRIIVEETVSSKSIQLPGRVENLPSEDKRLLLRASLGLLLKRLNHHIPVFRDDLVRLADCADERGSR
jgi:hypothetical protein